MATMPVTCYQAKCDYCGQVYESDDGEGAIWGDRRVAEEAAIGWKLDEPARGYRFLTCPACLRCEKCGSSPAWVGGDTYEDHGLVLCEDCEPPVLKVVTA